MSNFNFDLDAGNDEDFFGTLQSSKSSKLGQLFGEDVSQDETQQSLKYKRPKATDLPPSKNEASASSSSQQMATNSLTLMAKVVTAYKQGELQGKVGLALIKNAEDTLILYKSKSNILVTLRLAQDQQALFKQNKYWQFYDDLQVYWSFSFESQQDENDFREKFTSSGHTFKESEEPKDEKQQQPEHNTRLTSKQISIEANKDIDLPQLPIQDNTKETKNALIKRMAKMGQPLPKLSNNTLQTTTDFSDSSDTEVINTNLPQKPTIAPRANKLATLKNNQQLVTSSMAFNSAMYPTSAMESQYMQMLLTEQRTQGSELRMNVTKLENKIEKVLDKLDLIDRSGMVDPKEKRHKDDEILELEEKILNLKKENRKLKQLTEQRNEQESYDQKSKEILSEFNEDLKDLNMEHMKDLKTILKCCIGNIQESRKNAKELQDKCKESENNLKDEQTKLEAISISNNRLEKHVKDLEDNVKQTQINVEKQQKLITDYELQIKSLKEELQSKAEEKSQNSADSTVKTVMNNLFADICDKLENSHLDNSDKVLTIIATSIKQQTLKSLQQKQPGREE